MLKTLIIRELKRKIRKPQVLIQPIIFFLITLCLFPISLGSDENSLYKITPAALWITLLLACLINTNSLYTEDYHNGILSQDIIHIPSTASIIFAKIISAWVSFIVPFLIILPISGLFLHIPMTYLPQIALLLMLGSFTLILISSIGAVLTLNQSNNTFLSFLIVTPFFFPILILGTIATQRLMNGYVINGETAILAAFTIFSVITIIPLESIALKNQNLP